VLLIFALLVAKLSTNKNNIEIISVSVVEPNDTTTKISADLELAELMPFPLLFLDHLINKIQAKYQKRSSNR